MAKIVVTGDKELDRRLARIGGIASKRIMVKAIRSGIGEVSKAIRSQVPHKNVKRAISHRFKKRKGRYGYVAKAGGGVGKQKTVPSPTRGGVGISKRNVHWYLMGTQQRQTRRPNRRTGTRNTGAMPASPAVAAGFAKSGGAAMAKVRQVIARELEKEAGKLGRKK